MALPESPPHNGPDTGPLAETSGAALAARSRAWAGRIAWPSTSRRDHDGRWDAGLFDELATAPPGPGFAGPLVPRALGGAALTATDACFMLEGLAEGSRDPGLALAVAVHAALVTVPIRAFGTARQRERYLPRMASGEWTGALSLQQTQGTAHTPTVHARPAGPGQDGWILGGAIDLVAGAPVAHHFLIIAAHGDGACTAFVVDRETPGLLVTNDGPAAMPTCPWGRLVLDDCFLPDDAVLGTVHGASAEVAPLLAVLDWVFTSAPWLGIMRALIRDSVKAARDRRLFGRPLSHDQSARFALADLTTQSELAEGLLRQVASRFDHGGRPTPQEAATARLFTASAARTVVQGAARLTGPLPRSGDGLIERAHRDVLFLSESGGGTEVLRPVIAAALLGLG
ncbi:acyl-CoA dehydrogenase family protein [Streptomyces sp. AC602_WCS936]|uniref:acyl-CoA dehydrogenase family protein n=1 Tax=Streptomyces sp. AC602_WCS936 TaxID=2823685 RepID=UPI001C26A715|nr:acyl-CoA dehydrogenase family protein [Streptomyces sp. AC602_WCS936]